MRRSTGILFVTCLLIVAVSTMVVGQTQTATPADTGAIFPKGQRAPAANFTGTVWVYQLIDPDSAFNIPVGYVTFEPGARSHWHSHAGGQVLLAMGALGTIRRKESPFGYYEKAIP